jgi:hypothetical protein
VVVMTTKVSSEDDLTRLNHRVCALIRKDGTICEQAFRQLVDQLRRMEAGKEQYGGNSTG